MAAKAVKACIRRLTNLIVTANLSNFSSLFSILFSISFPNSFPASYCSVLFTILAEYTERAAAAAQIFSVRPGPFDGVDGYIVTLTWAAVSKSEIEADADSDSDSETCT